MDIRIQAIHFDIADALTAFINKKVERLARRYPEITVAEVTLKVVKPETAMNKEAIVKLTMPGHADAVANKVADTFEEAVDLSLEALDRQLEKQKGK
ncbi:MAG: ribosome-associated translation inhibitor RaiA [Muribaculaceae bacterium]|nr:ribosome-associated translation inhibitor RaiA [Muribaculaceae bacterium]MDE6486163.1 ribosome-associated translation inhibitor RaiA [Muribaculaceae bacterium]